MYKNEGEKEELKKKLQAYKEAFTMLKE